MITLAITGPIVDILRIYKSDFDFQSLYPCPYLSSTGELLDDGPDGVEDATRWCQRHWSVPTAVVPDAVFVEYYTDELAGSGHYIVKLVDLESSPTAFIKRMMKLFPLIQISAVCEKIDA